MNTTQEIPFDQLLDQVYEGYSNKEDRDLIGALVIQHELHLRELNLEKKKASLEAIFKLQSPSSK